MKRVILSAFALVIGVSTSIAQYCTGGPGFTGDSNVGTIALTGSGGTSISYDGLASCPGILGLDDQTAMSVDLEIGGSYSIDIDWSTCGGSYGNAATAWIDFDGSTTFDVGEEIATWSGVPPSGVQTYPFTVPATAVLGGTRLRVNQQESGILPLNPCATYNWGSSTDFTVNLVCPSPVVTDVTICTGTSTTLNATVADGTINWYDGMMTLLATGPSYVTPALGANTSYNVTTTIAAGTCMGESPAVINTVTVSPVDITLNPINESCIGLGDGSFSEGVVTCGIAPFDFSVDGGAFGPIPTNLTSGTYSVVVRDANMDQSLPISVVIGANSTVIPNAPTTASPVNACGGVGSLPITATASASEFYTYTIDGYDDWGDGWNGASVTVLADGVPVLSNWSVAGSGSITTFSVPEGAVLTTSWVSGSFDSECSYDIYDQNMMLVASVPLGGGTITPYNVPMGAYTLNWYDAPGGTLLGTGSPFETVGTSVMPTANTGVYDFFVTQFNGCESSASLITVNVSDVLVTLSVTDESCTGNADGTFGISSVSCGTAPFSFSVDGGAFGPAPTNMTPGTYSIVVQDAAMLQSQPELITIGTQSTVIPAAPIALSPVQACSGAGSIMINAAASPMMLTYTITGNDSFGDGWNGNSVELSADGNPVINFTFNSGSTLTSTFSVPEGTTLTSLWSPGSFIGECSYTVFDENMNVVGTSASGSEITPYVIPMGTYTINWYDVPAGTNLGSGSPFETVGTSVMPTATVGSYDFYATTILGGCESSETLVTVEVADVLVSLAVTDETCIGYANGTFGVSAVSCGTAPFNFSVDGGAFGAAPTNLTAGTYSVVVQDASMLQSNPISITINSVGTTIPQDPMTSDTTAFACVGDPSILIGNNMPLLGGTLLTTMAAGNGFDANMFTITANTTVMIDSFAVNANTGSANFEVWYRPDDYLLVPGANTSNVGWTQVGAATGIAATTGVATDIPANLGVTIPAGQTYSFMVYSNIGLSYTNGTAVGNVFAADANITFYEGHGGAYFGLTNSPRVFNGNIYYSIPQNWVWFDGADPMTDNLEGTGAPFETVGTAVLPDANTAGTYPFYLATENNGCYSVNTQLVNVYVDPVNVDLVSIDATCNGAADGSFAISNVHCGVAPFSFSVDGGAFGAIPTNLTPGLYSIQVMDANSDVSAVYSFTVGDAPAPQNIYMSSIDDQGGQVNWDEGGSESAWFIEWGLPGFTPGTGTEVGSATSIDTFYMIMGLNSNETYDVYVAADCGSGSVNDWAFVSFTTECGVFSTPFVETFEDDSESRICWKNLQEVGAADWTYQTGSTGGNITTAYEGTLNAQFVSLGGTNDPITKLYSPRFDFAGQDSVALVFAHGQQNWVGDQNITKVYVNGPTSPWVEIQSYNTDVPQWTVDTLFLADTTYQIAFEGINNWGYANVVDYVQILPCTLIPGSDGAVDICRADSILDLNSVVTRGEFFGRWSFPQNETFITNDSIASIGLLPAGTHYFYYIVETPCASDTTIAAVTVFGPSSAGNDGNLTACQNEPINLLAGLGGNVDMGGTWYDPSNNPITGGANGSITTATIAGNYNYDYITSNGVCPADTANVVVAVGTCDYLNIQEVYFGSMEVYPNPTSGVVYITNSGVEDVYDYQLTDAQGKVLAVKENAINGIEATEVDLSKLEPGIYMIKVYNESIETTYRIVKL